jgi:hypothetical protein
MRRRFALRSLAREGERRRSSEEKDDDERERREVGGLGFSPSAGAAAAAAASVLFSSVSPSTGPQSSSLTRAARSPTGKTWSGKNTEKKRENVSFFLFLFRVFSIFFFFFSLRSFQAK